MKSYRYATVRYPRGKILVITLILWFSISSAFVIIGSNSILKGQETESWPSTTGVIVSSYLDDDRSSDGTTYGAKITYQYTLNGVSYTSYTISYGYAYTSDRSAARALVEEYTVGKTVTVYYNPSVPYEAVLIKGVTGASWLFFSVGMFFVILGVLVTVYIGSKNKEEKSSNQINILLDKKSYSPGETIKGTVNLNLNKQRRGKSLKVMLVVNRDFEYPQAYNKEASNSFNIYKEEIILDTEKDYQNQTYSFLIKIPLDMLEKVERLSTEGMVGTVKKFSQWGANRGFGNYIEKNTWYVFASLELTKRSDISNKVEINVSNTP